MVILRTCQWVLLGSLVWIATGCSFFHDLQPHRLHRLNRVPDMMSGSGYNFSIPPEPIPDIKPPTSNNEEREADGPNCASNVCPE